MKKEVTISGILKSKELGELIRDLCSVDKTVRVKSDVRNRLHKIIRKAIEDCLDASEELDKMILEPWNSDEGMKCREHYFERIKDKINRIKS